MDQPFHAAAGPLLRGVAAVEIRRAHDRRRAPRRVVLDADRPWRLQPRTTRHGNRDPPARSTSAAAASGIFVDLGCGAGPIALTLALRAPLASVLAVDVNSRARSLVYATTPARLGLTNVTVAHPDEVPADTRRRPDLVEPADPHRQASAPRHPRGVARAAGTRRVGRAGRATPPRRRLARPVAAFERAERRAASTARAGYRLLECRRRIVRCNRSSVLGHVSDRDDNSALRI